MKTLFLTILLCAAVPVAAQDTLRCGPKIVQIGMTMAEVKEYCGNPSSTTIEQQDVRAGPRVVGKTEIHIWRYERLSGQRTAVVEFDQRELRSIAYESD